MPLWIPQSLQTAPQKHNPKSVITSQGSSLQSIIILLLAGPRHWLTKLSMKKISILASALMLFCFSSASTALTDSNFEHISEQLYTSTKWLKLGHYQPKNRHSTSFQSTITSKQFFLSEQGKSNPKLELLATLKAIYQPIKNDQNSHAQCKFRARYLWLKNKINFNNEPIVSCPEYLRFTSNDDIESISLVLATGYLGNPASYYGHLLLKFNTPNSDINKRLLDQSINYGAILPDQTSPITYILNGLLGGYKGGFTHIQYYFHNHQYGENELRDLWEYELRLPPEDVKLITAHAWELLGNTFKYFFIKRNCAYQMADLLALSDKVRIPKPYSVFAIPQTLIQKTNELGLIEKIHYHPSRQTTFYDNYKNLSPAAKTLLKESSQNPDRPQSFSSAQLSQQERRDLIDTTIDYYQYVKLKNHAGKLPKSYYEALKASISEPSANANKQVNNIISGPESSRSPSLLRISAITSSSNQDGVGIKIRPAYYDPLDADIGHRANGGLSMLEIDLRLSQDQVTLNSFDIFSVENSNHSNTDLRDDGGHSWRLKAGIERQNNSCSHCLVGRFQGDIGLSYQINNNHFVNGYIGGAIQENKNNQGVAFLRATLSDTFIWKNFASKIAIELREHDKNTLKSEHLFFTEARYQVGKNTEIRAKISKNIAYESEIGFGWYW